MLCIASKPVIATDLKPGVVILQSLHDKFHASSTSGMGKAITDVTCGPIAGKPLNKE